MAIALDSASSGNFSSGGSTTWSHTVSGSNTILFVSTSLRRNNASVDNITGVTYNGVSMTQLSKSTITTSSTGTGSISIIQYLYYLINPATGSNTISISYTPFAGQQNQGCSSSYTGVKQIGQPDAFTTGKSTNGTDVTTITGSVTTVADKCWVVMGAEASGTNITASTNATERGVQQGQVGIYDSNGQITPAGSFSMTVTASSGAMAYVIASFVPAPVITNGNFLAFI